MVPIGLRVQRFATTALPAYGSREGGIVTRVDLQDVIARALSGGALGLRREYEADAALLRLANGRTKSAAPDMNERLKVGRRKPLANGRLWVSAQRKDPVASDGGERRVLVTLAHRALCPEDVYSV